MNINFDKTQPATHELIGDMTREQYKRAYAKLLAEKKELEEENEKLRRNQPDLDLGIR